MTSFTLAPVAAIQLAAIHCNMIASPALEVRIALPYKPSIGHGCFVLGLVAGSDLHSI